MEIKSTIKGFMQGVRLYLCVLAVFSFAYAAAQKADTVNTFTIRNGKIYIELSKNIANEKLDQFIDQFDLNGIGLKWFIQRHQSDSLEKAGWKMEINNNNVVVLSKTLMGSDEILLPEQRILFTEKHPTIAEMFPPDNNGILYGYNRFRNKSPFAVKDSTVTFYLRNHTKASHVLLAGSFTSWQNNAVSMFATDSGWIVKVNLKPGKYWYKFIVDGNWTKDEDNLLSENDGMGNINSVFYKTNVVFKLDQYSNARKVYLSGSFNNWKRSELAMQKTGTGWQLPLYLSEGTYTYRFVVDGNWMADPANPDKFPNEYNEYNSVIRLGKAHLFRLDGYANAKKVMLVGSFNDWRNFELPMNKTATGWELPYTLGDGNYEYGFLVDGKTIPDPANPLHVGDHSYMVIAPNYTFRLKGYPAAKSVMLSGDFDNWSPNTISMVREGNEWVYSVHLSAGKHLYKFLVDGKWITDPGNPLWEQNEYGTGNSVIWFSD